MQHYSLSSRTNTTVRVRSGASVAEQKIRAGQTVAMWYPSANRDEEVFDEPYTFNISRDPNEHFAFGGYGEHFCLGANLARWEMRSLFGALISILPRMEITAAPERLAGQLHVGGIKRLMVRATA